MLRNVTILFLTTFFFCFIIVSALYADIEDTVQKSFQVGQGGTLTLETDLGSIEVTGDGGNQVKVEIIRKVDTGSTREAKDILENLDMQFDQNGDDVNITVKYNREKEGLFRWIKNSKLRLSFKIQVPEKYNVDLQTAGGSISVDDLEGEVNTKTSGGSLKFGEIVGPVYGRTSGGSIALEQCEGTADVKTSGGSISIGEVDGDVEAHTSGGSLRITQARGSVNASTSGGSITVEEVMGTINASTSGGSVTARISSQPESDCSLSTSGGSVNAHLADNLQLDVDAKTSGGRVQTDFPVTVQGELKKTELQAKINGGGPILKLRTSGGSIYVKKLND